MKKLMIACLLTLWAGAAAGQILECVDAKGKKEYTSQRCPPGTVKETTINKSGSASSNSASTPSPAAAPGKKSTAELEADFRKRTQERQDAEAKAEKDRVEARDAERNCNDARAQMKLLQDGGRIARTDPNTGERSFLQDKDRPTEIASAQKAVDGWCKKR